ncbi:MAG: RNA polymerase sigma factor SigZ [Saprospiraceae bacterium]|nr:RNA polymerase sigma factor SigZ [Saprospiraceae bacterium]
MNEIQNIWAEFHRALKGLIVKTVKDPNDADDILQDIFLKIMLHSDKIERADNLRHYLYGIARNATQDYFRKKNAPIAEPQLEETMPAEEPARSLNTAIAECCVRNFVAQLPDKYREALILTEFEALSQKELARRLGISYSGAKSRVQRGKEKLKELIVDCCAYESDRYGNLLDTGKKNCSC